jgi:peptidylprolyl isomerase
MKLASMFLLLATSAALVAQTKTPPTAASAQKTAVQRTPTAAASRACTKLPTLSPKIPALPADAPCARALYTITTVPSAKLSDASPQLAASIRETLGLEPMSFTLSYVDTKAGAGPLAAPQKWYTVNYTGYLVDGTKFDSSYDHPDHAPFVLQQGQHQVIAGWDTGFAGMHIGGKRRLFIPWQLAYSAQPHGAIPAKSILVFDVELISQSNEKPATPTPPTPPAAAAPAAPARPIPGTPMGTNPAPSNAVPPTAKTVPVPSTTTTPSGAPTSPAPSTTAPAPPPTTAPKPQ